MLEWSKRRKTKSGTFNSLADAYDDLLYEYKNCSNYPNIQIPEADNSVTQYESVSIAEMQNDLEQRLIKLNLKHITLHPRKSTPQTWEEMCNCYLEYQKLQPVFIKFLGFQDAKSCHLFGLNDQNIKLMQQGIIPENFNIHLKLPFDFGGQANLSNLSLIHTHPTHDNIHQIIDYQIENDFMRCQKMIFIPWFEGRFCHD